MTVKITTIGDGITAKECLTYSANEDRADERIRKADRVGSLEGLLASVEEECFAIMSGDGLPTCFGGFTYSKAGEWQLGGLQKGWGVCNGIWPIARNRGHSQDSLIGFSARMLDDIVWLRRSAEQGDHDRVALMAFFLGVKKAELRIKLEHEATWTTGKKVNTGAKAGGDSRRGIYSGRNDRMRSRYAELLERVDIPTALAALARQNDLSIKQVRRIVIVK